MPVTRCGRWWSRWWRYIARDEVCRDPQQVPRILLRFPPGPPGSAELQPGAVRRPDAPLYQRGDGAVQARLPGPGAPRLRAGGDLPEVRAGGWEAQRSGAGGPHGPAPDLLRDARQLLLRRLLQAGGDRVRLGVGHERALAGD